MTAPADRVRLNATRCHRGLSVPAGSYVPEAEALQCPLCRQFFGA